MYEYTLSFLNYWKATGDENVEYKKKVTLPKNTFANI